MELNNPTVFPLYPYLPHSLLLCKHPYPSVYSFVNEFLKDEFLYKFTVDEAEEYELIQKRARSFERAKHVYTRYGSETLLFYFNSYVISSESSCNCLNWESSK